MWDFTGGGSSISSDSKHWIVGAFFLSAVFGVSAASLSYSDSNRNHYHRRSSPPQKRGFGGSGNRFKGRPPNQDQRRGNNSNYRSRYYYRKGEEDLSIQLDRILKQKYGSTGFSKVDENEQLPQSPIGVTQEDVLLQQSSLPSVPSDSHPKLELSQATHRRSSDQPSSPLPPQPPSLSPLSIPSSASDLNKGGKPTSSSEDVPSIVVDSPAETPKPIPTKTKQSIELPTTAMVSPSQQKGQKQERQPTATIPIIIKGPNVANTNNISVSLSTNVTASSFNTASTLTSTVTASSSVTSAPSQPSPSQPSPSLSASSSPTSSTSTSDGESGSEAGSDISLTQSLSMFTDDSFQSHSALSAVGSANGSRSTSGSGSGIGVGSSGIYGVSGASGSALGIAAGGRSGSSNLNVSVNALADPVAEITRLRQQLALSRAANKKLEAQVRYGSGLVLFSFTEMFSGFFFYTWNTREMVMMYDGNDKGEGMLRKKETQVSCGEGVDCATLYEKARRSV
jgi:hypothetical protein